MKKLLAALLCLLILLPLGAHGETAGELYESILPDSVLPVGVCEVPAEDMKEAALRAASDGEDLAGHWPGKAEDEEAVIELGRMALMAHCGLGSDALDEYLCRAAGVTLSDGRAAWAVSLFSNAYRPIDAVLLFDAQSGQLLRMETTTRGWFSLAQARWEAVYGPYGIWPLETQVFFDVIYSQELAHAVPGEDFYPEEKAIAAAIEAAGLQESAGHVTWERTLALNPSAPREDAHVWMITLFLGGMEAAQVNISALDGHVIDFFPLSLGVG